MIAVCTNSILKYDFDKDNQYYVCPTLGGYQVTNHYGRTIGITDEKFNKCFKVVEERIN